MTLGVKVPRSMALLVSVADADEAIAALEGGADVIDAKDPLLGALGAVRPEIFSEIHGAVAGRAVVTAALGDAYDVHRTERLATEYSGRGASFVKIGFAGVGDCRRVDALIAAAVRGCVQGSGVIAVAYADASHTASVDARSLVDVAARSGARGVLVDTADKSSEGLTALWAPARIASWVAEARGWGLLGAVAGKLSIDDFAIVGDAAADIVGVRGAACDDGRTSRISANRVRTLREAIANEAKGGASDLVAGYGVRTPGPSPTLGVST